MKKRSLAVLIPFALLLSFPSVFPLSAASETVKPVSPALTVLAAEYPVSVLSENGEPAKLSADVLEEGLGGGRLRSITVVSLPPITEGKLMLGQTDVVKNQVISRSALSGLTFYPTGSGDVTSSFSFRAGEARTYDITCLISCLDGEDSAPVPTSNEKIITYSDITCFDCLNGSDPDGDPVSFMISSYPENGLLVLNDRENGDYTYTPVNGYSGKDSFRYTVTDRYGKSTEGKITVEVVKNKSGMIFGDMIGKYAHKEAIDAVNAGILDCKTEMGSRTFSPDEEISRLDFLTAAMRSAGYRIATTVSNTGFADDSSIRGECKGYVSAAVKMGFVTGTEENGKTNFNPDKPITFSEAAVIVNRILDLPVPVSFTPDPSVPVWAAEAYTCMNANGLFSSAGKYSPKPDKEMNRADAAVLLTRVTDYRKANQ